MPWTSPPTFVSGQVVTATDLNTFLRDNTNYLLARAYAHLLYKATYNSTSTSFVDVDATNLILSLNISSGRALVMAAVNFNSGNTADYVAVDIIVDSTTRLGDATHGLSATRGDYNADNSRNFIVAVVTGLSVGSHTFKLQFKASNAAVPVYINRYAGANTVALPILMMVVEI